MLVDTVERAEIGEQGGSPALAYPAHPGDVVGGVAHYRLHIHELRDRDAVLFAELLLVHYNGSCVLLKYDADLVVDKLQKVAVARENVAFRVVGTVRHFCDGALYVVRLIPR